MNIQKATINIIDEIINEGGFEHCVILTFNSGLSFYENVILRKLWASGCYNNVILMDGRQYDELIKEEAGDVQFCGKYYALDPIRIKGAFHPKIVLLTSQTGGKLLIGSGNVTFPGYGNNYELFYKFEYNEDRSKHLGVFKQVVEFISDLSKRNYLNPATQKRVTLMLSDTSWLSSDVQKVDEIFLHNLAEPLLDQVIERMPRDINKIVLMAPYFDNKIAVVEKIQRIFRNVQIKIIIQDNNSNFPLQYFMDNKVNYPNVTLHKFRSEEGSRRLHAKMLYFSSDKYEHLFSGSPNISRPALVKYADNGNVECGIFIKSEKQKGPDLSLIWRNNMETNKIDSINDVSAWEIPIEFKKITSENQIYIKGAYIKESIFFIDYESKIDGYVDVVINGSIAAKENINQGSGNIEHALDSNITECLTKGANTVCISYKGSESNTIWIHNFTIMKPGSENTITRHMNSLGSYIVNIEMIKAIIELTTPYEIKQGYENDLFKGNKLGDQEEKGEQAELPEHKFFVEEKPEYQDIFISSSGAGDESKYDIFGQLFGGIAKLTSEHNRAIASERKQILNNKTGQKLKIINQPSIEDIRKKLLTLIDRTIDRTVSYINKDDIKLSLSDLMTINQLAASLTWFLNGIKIEFRDDQVNVSINNSKYIDSIIALLHRVWVETKESDFLSGHLRENDYKLFSLVNIITLPLCLIPYCMCLIRKDDGRFETVETDFSKLSDIFLAIHSIIHKAPQGLVSNMITEDKINNIYNKLFQFSGDFRLPDLCWQELFSEAIVPEDLLRALKIAAFKHKKDIQRKKRVELHSIKKTRKKLNYKLIKAKPDNNNIGGGILDLVMGEQAIDRIEGEKEKAEKIITANIEVDPNIDKCSLAANTKRLFGL